MDSDDKDEWLTAARADVDNFDRHGVKIEVAEDSLTTWNPRTRRASEVVDMMWVLKKKKDEKGDLLKFKARAVVCGNQQKAKSQHLGNQHLLETFAPAARNT
eukprot:4428830-Pleurochrysis_carterae.AAC.1